MNDFVRANSDVAKSGIGPQSWETFVDTASTENRLFTTKVDENFVGSYVYYY